MRAGKTEDSVGGSRAATGLGAEPNVNAGRGKAHDADRAGDEGIDAVGKPAERRTGDGGDLVRRRGGRAWQNIHRYQPAQGGRSGISKAGAAEDEHDRQQQFARQHLLPKRDQQDDGGQRVTVGQAQDDALVVTVRQMADRSVSTTVGTN